MGTDVNITECSTKFSIIFIMKPTSIVCIQNLTRFRFCTKNAIFWEFSQKLKKLPINFLQFLYLEILFSLIRKQSWLERTQTRPMWYGRDVHQMRIFPILVFF